MKDTLFGQMIPSTGGFSVFSITEVDALGIHEVAIRPWSPEGELNRQEPPADLLEDLLGDGTNSPLPFHSIILKEAISIPDASGSTFNSLISGAKWGDPLSELYDEMMSACCDDLLGFGGYLKGTSGEDPSPDMDHLKFAILRINPDAGIVHFAVPSADLSSGNLDRVQYVWSDWDS